MYTFADDKKQTVRNFKYAFGLNGNETAQYVIRKEVWENGVKKDFEAILDITGLRLRLYNTGVGILVFELVNYDRADVQSINRINDFGRRIFSPYIIDSEGKCPSCADELFIQVYDSKENEAYPVFKGEKPADDIRGDEFRLASFITGLLSNKKYAVTTDRSHGSEEFFIEPIIDDRMFTACFYRNKEFAEEISRRDSGYKFLTDAEALAPDDKDSCARKLYEYTFVDGDGITCLSREMLRDMLEKHIYCRWIEWGTVSGITEYSMVTVTSSAADHLAATFLTEYVEMAALVLAQRASLLAFEYLISESAAGKYDVRKVQNVYIMFETQLMLREVTPQQQGIEMYDMLTENLLINKERSEIESQIRSLFDSKSADTDEATNLLLAVLAAIGATEVVPAWFEGCACFEALHPFIQAFLICAVIILIYLAIRKKRK